MKKNALFALMAVVPLMVLSCAKEIAVEAPEQERPTMIDPWTAIDQTPYMKNVAGDAGPLVAGFVQTKAYMEMNGADNFAKVVWSPGDSFKMYGYDSGFYGATYTTSGGGEKAIFTPNYSVSPSPQHSIFAPGSGSPMLGHDDNGVFFGLTLPDTQEAVAGKVKDDYIYSYARSINQSDNLTFKNIVGLVRFKMSGSAAAAVKSVTLRGATAIAGEFIIMPNSEGIPAISVTKNFGGERSATITLSGTFAPDTWYYFAVVPGVQTGLSLVFSDGMGHTTTKIASKTVTFAQGEISDLGTINLGSAFSDPAVPDMSTIKFMSATAGAPKPVTLAVIPDGFTSAEMSKYEMLAKSAMNTLFNVEPFKSYKEYFNVYIMKVASNESGARITDGTTAEQNRDCYFESAWGGSTYDDMEANDTKIRDFVKANCPDILDATHTINEVPILLIINDSRYGGICHTSSTGFGYCMAPYTDNGGRLAWSYPSLEAVSDSDPAAGVVATPDSRKAEVGSNAGNWLNTMVHEFGGHCFSKLADEYWYNTDRGATTYIFEHRYDYLLGGVPFGLNVSATYLNPGYDDPGDDPAYIKEGWQHLLDKKDALVAYNPLYSRIGVFQGGQVSVLNRWRSERVSCMIDNRFYFSTFQRELIVKRIMTLAGAAFDETSFWAKDVPTDPVRDIVSSPVMGVEDPVAPRIMPPLPPPVFHTDW